MKIVFDAYWWVSGPASLRHVVRETVLGWRTRFPDDEITIVVPSRDAESARGDVPPGVVVRKTRLWPQALAATIACRREARRVDADVVFVQNFATGGGGLRVVFLHDVLFVTNPEWFSRPERMYFSFMARWAGRADLVLTSSATEADRILHHSTARKVVAVGIGMSTELVAAVPVPVAGLTAGCFMLTVGRLNVRKNLGPTIEAALDSGQISADRPLVVVGSADGKGEQLPERVARAVEDGSVIFAGFVGDAELSWLYSNTALFLFLSLGEGFGMPPREALHFGAPLIVSDIEVFRETMPADVVRVDPRDVDGIAAAIRAHIEGSPRGRMADPAEDRSWPVTVEAMHAAVMVELAARTGKSRRRPGRGRTGAQQNRR